MTAALGEVALASEAGTGAEVASTRSSAAATRSATVTNTRTLPRSGGGSSSGSTGGRAGGAARRAAPSVAGGAVGSKLTGGRKDKSDKGSKGKRHSPAGRVLIAEFIVCLAIVALSGLTDKHKDDSPGDLIKRLTGVTFLFAVLGLVSSGGRTSGKIAAGFGGIVTVALMVSDRDVFAVLAARIGAPAKSGDAGPSDDNTVDVGQPAPGSGSGRVNPRPPSGGTVNA